MKHAPTLLLLLAVLLAVTAAPAHAGESLSGDGYQLQLPSEFEAAPDDQKAAGARIRSRFGSMPLDGSPKVRIFLAGQAHHPAATLSLARLDLTSPIRTHKDLGRRQIAAMEARTPAGFEFTSLQVGRHDAIQMEFSSLVDGEAHTSRVLSVACGDYLVVIMLESADGRFPDAADAWNELVGSLEIVPPSQDLMLIALVGLGALILLGLLARLARMYAKAGRDPVTRRSHVSEFVLPGARGTGAPTSEIRPPRRAAPARDGLLNTLPRDRR